VSPNYQLLIKYSIKNY